MSMRWNEPHVGKREWYDEHLNIHNLIDLAIFFGRIKSNHLAKKQACKSINS